MNFRGPSFRTFLFSAFACACALVPSGARAQDAPHAFVQLGHAQTVYSSAFTPDGKNVLSGDMSGAVKLWDVASGREVRTFQRPTVRTVAPVFSLVATPDGTGFYSAAGSEIIEHWDIDSGRLVGALPGQSMRVSLLALSPDGRYLASAGGLDGKHELKLRDLRSDRTFDLRGHTGGISGLAFSVDGTMLVSAGNYADGSIRVWNAADGSLSRTIPTGDALGGLSVCPDGKSVLVFGGRLLKKWSIETGRLLSTFEQNPELIFSVTVSPDGRLAVTGDRGSRVTLWDLETGKRGGVLGGARSHERDVKTVAFSPDGRMLVSGSADCTLALWEVKSRALLHRFQQSAQDGMFNYTIGAPAFSADGEKMIMAGGNYKWTNLHVWDLHSGQQEKVISVKKYNPYTVRISPDGRLAALIIVESEGVEDYILLFDIRNERESRRIACGSSNAVSFSTDGARLIVSGGKNIVSVWETATGKKLWEDRAHSPTDTIEAVAVSADTQRAYALSRDSLKAWDARNGKLLYSRPAGGGSTAFALSPDGRRLALIHGGELVIHDARTGEPRSKAVLEGEPIAVIRFRADGKSLLIGRKDGFAILKPDGRTEKLMAYPWGDRRYLTGYTAVSPDDRHLLAAGPGTTARLIRLADGESINLLPRVNMWVAYADDGVFDASTNGGGEVNVACGRKVFAIDQFALKNNRPDILLGRMGLLDEETSRHYYAQFRKRLRKSGFDESILTALPHVPTAEIIEAATSAATVSLTFRLSDAEVPLKSYNLYANDVPLFGSYGKTLSSREATLTEQIQLAGGNNKIEVSCMNEKGAESHRALVFARRDGPVRGDLYVLVFGVSRYRDARLNLKFAAKDARDLVATFREMEGRRYAAVHTKLILDEDVTPEAIKSAKAFTAGAKVDDTYVLFIAGHGVHDSGPEAGYYFLTHAADLKNLSASAASFDLVEDLLQGIAPRGKVFLMDTCESGEAETTVQKSGLEIAVKSGIQARTARGLQVQSRERPAAPRAWVFRKDRYIYNDLVRRSGAIVFSSSRGDEFSYESEAVGNGFFTKKIVDGLHGNAGIENGMVGLDALRVYVSEEVAKMSENLQHPTIDRDNLFQKIYFPAVK